MENIEFAQKSKSDEINYEITNISFNHNQKMELIDNIKNIKDINEANKFFNELKKKKIFLY